jgi:hypothetical protein
MLKPYEITIDMIILVDILVNLVTEKVENGELVIHLKDAAVMYLKSFFVIDLISILPTLLFWEGNAYLYSIKFVRFLRIRRLFAFFTIIEDSILSFFQTVRLKSKVNNYISMVKILVLSYLIFHFFSCALIFTGTYIEI